MKDINLPQDNNNLQFEQFEKVALNEVLAAVNAGQNQDLTVNLNNEKPSKQDNVDQGANSSPQENSENANGNVMHEDQQVNNKQIIQDLQGQEGQVSPPNNSDQGENVNPLSVEDLENLPKAQADQVPLSYLIIDGHDENLLYNPYGDPYIVQSVPRDLGIPPFPPAVEKVYFPTELPQEVTVVAPTSIPPTVQTTPCFTSNITILTDNGGSPSNGSSAPPIQSIFLGLLPAVEALPTFLPTLYAEYLQYQNYADPLYTAFENLLNQTFKFTYEYFCSTNTSEIVYTVNPTTLPTLENFEYEFHEFFQAGILPLPPEYGNGFISDEGVIETVIAGPGINPSNPITTVFLPSGIYDTFIGGENGIGNLLASGSYLANINDFVNADPLGAQFLTQSQTTTFLNGETIPTFLDVGYPGGPTTYSYYQLYPNGGGGYYLANTGMGTPIVLNLSDHSGFEFSSTTQSNVYVNMNGYLAEIGWLEPGEGLLTFNYSGHGPLNASNFMLTQDVQGATSDLQALAILAGQSGGVLNASNPIWNELGVFIDGHNGNAASGKYFTLSQLGIVSINLTETATSQVINGNTINGLLNFTYANGKVGQAADVSLTYHDVLNSSNNIPGVSNTVASVNPVSHTTSSDPIVPVHTDLAVQSAIDGMHHHHHAHV